MLNISSPAPVIWPSATATGVAPVSATTPVTPVQATARDAQTNLGQRQERPMPDSVRRSAAPSAEGSAEPGAADAAPLLPRESPDSPDGQASPELAEAKAERQKAEAQAEEKALKQQLQDVLSNVWKASAAVVEVVLGREAEMAEAGKVDAAAQAERPEAANPAPRAAQARPGAPAQAANDAVVERVAARAAQDVVAYDAHGNSSWAPLEAGSLLSRRV
jgi:hypothetical protein